MVVGVLTLDILIHESRSLKAKRSVLKSLKDRLRNTFNLAVAEVGALDMWNEAHLGIVVVGSDRQHINSTLDAVLNFVGGFDRVDIRDHAIELLSGWDWE